MEIMPLKEKGEEKVLLAAYHLAKLVQMRNHDLDYTIAVTMNLQREGIDRKETGPA